MSMVYFYAPAALAWLWLIPVMAGLFVFASAKRRRAMRQFGAGIQIRSRKREAIAACAGAALVILALARPAWDLKEERLQETGRDVVFLVDVSRSMLAEDMHPNRLENAKLAILDCIEALSGDRVGLVIFAGSAEIRCPLTVDYDYFRMALRQVSPDSVTVGGTQIANAIDKVVNKLLKPEKAGLQDVILITDGEDQVEGADEVDSARLLSDAGARLIAIGIGDRARGSRIVEEDEDSGVRSFMKHDKKEVWTRLHSETLRQMVAAVPSGTYFEVASGPFDLKGIYQQVMQRVERTTVEKQVVESYEDKFHLFLFAAVTVLLLSNPWKRNSKPWKNGRAAKTAALVLLLLSSLSVRAKESAAGLFRQGNKAYAAEKFDVAAEKFQAAGELDPESAEIYFNLGSALYRNGAFEEARGSFEYAASVSDSEQMKSQCWYNLANSMVKTAETLRLQDPHSALEFYQQAAYIYRTALDYNMEFADAAYNMEVTRMLTAQLTEEIRQEEEKEQQENEMFKYIREKLEEFILRQTALNIATTADTLSAAAQQQQTLEKETRELTEVMKETGLHEAIPFPDGTAEPGPLQKTFEHTLKAAAAMERAQQYPALDPVQMEQKIALEELIAALGSAPADPNQQEGESDEDSSESDDSDMDYDESDEDSDMYEEADPFGDFSEYEEIRGVPPPNQTEMDILAEEARNQERRKQKKGGQYKGVDKDW